MTAAPRYPRVPHLVWLGAGAPRDDKVLAPADTDALLSHALIVEEKIDGANLGISIGDDGRFVLQNRGTILISGQADRQFDPLWGWLEVHRAALADALHAGLAIFGEWCYARHSLHYTRLPDWFVAFDVYDRRTDRFWCVARRDALLAQAGLAAAPRLARGRFTLEQLQALFARTSAFGDAPIEGVVVRHDEGDWLTARAKLVAPAFTQAIEQHWTSRPLERNARGRT